MLLVNAPSRYGAAEPPTGTRPIPVWLRRSLSVVAWVTTRRFEHLVRLGDEVAVDLIHVKSDRHLLREAASRRHDIVLFDWGNPSEKDADKQPQGLFRKLLQQSHRPIVVATPLTAATALRLLRMGVADACGVLFHGIDDVSVDVPNPSRRGGCSTALLATRACCRWAYRRMASSASGGAGASLHEVSALRVDPKPGERLWSDATYDRPLVRAERAGLHECPTVLRAHRLRVRSPAIRRRIVDAPRAIVRSEIGARADRPPTRSLRFHRPHRACRGRGSSRSLPCSIVPFSRVPLQPAARLVEARGEAPRVSHADHVCTT